MPDRPQATSAHAGRSPATLLRGYHTRLVVFALRRLGDRDDAEDAAQETLRRVLEALEAGTIRNIDALPGFVIQTARHVCQQTLRKRSRETRALDRLESDTPEQWHLLLDQLVDEERRHEVERALGGLSGEDRHLLYLFYGQGLVAEEVAALLDVRPGTVRVRKHRALERLAMRLEANGRV